MQPLRKSTQETTALTPPEPPKPKLEIREYPGPLHSTRRPWSPRVWLALLILVFLAALAHAFLTWYRHTPPWSIPERVAFGERLHTNWFTSSRALNFEKGSFVTLGRATTVDFHAMSGVRLMHLHAGTVTAEVEDMSTPWLFQIGDALVGICASKFQASADRHTRTANVLGFGRLLVDEDGKPSTPAEALKLRTQSTPPFSFVEGSASFRECQERLAVMVVPHPTDARKTVNRLRFDNGK